MKSRIILQEIKPLIDNFEDFDKESYEALMNLNTEDIKKQTNNYYKATDLLESLFYYKQIKDALKSDEIIELHSLCTKSNYQYLEKALEISNLSGLYIDELETEEIHHPVCERHTYRDFMSYTEYALFEYLEIYKELIDQSLNFQIDNLLYQRNKYLTLNREIRFQNIVLPGVFAALAQKNTEKILISLIPYASDIVEKEIGLNGEISIVNSNIMQLLYEHNQIEADFELINLYHSMEKTYLENKYYHSKYQNNDKLIDNYKEMCKKM